MNKGRLFRGIVHSAWPELRNISKEEIIKLIPIATISSYLNSLAMNSLMSPVASKIIELLAKSIFMTIHSVSDVDSFHFHNEGVGLMTIKDTQSIFWKWTPFIILEVAAAKLRENIIIRNTFPILDRFYQNDIIFHSEIVFGYITTEIRHSVFGRITQDIHDIWKNLSNEIDLSGGTKSDRNILHKISEQIQFPDNSHVFWSYSPKKIMTFVNKVIINEGNKNRLRPVSTAKFKKIKNKKATSIIRRCTNKINFLPGPSVDLILDYLFMENICNSSSFKETICFFSCILDGFKQKKGEVETSVKIYFGLKSLFKAITNRTLHLHYTKQKSHLPIYGNSSDAHPYSILPRAIDFIQRANGFAILTLELTNFILRKMDKSYQRIVDRKFATITQLCLDCKDDIVFIPWVVLQNIFKTSGPIITHLTLSGTLARAVYSMQSHFFDHGFIAYRSLIKIFPYIKVLRLIISEYDLDTDDEDWNGPLPVFDASTISQTCFCIPYPDSLGIFDLKKIEFFVPNTVVSVKSTFKWSNFPHVQIEIIPIIEKDFSLIERK